jgi:hypothetical protein
VTRLAAGWVALGLATAGCGGPDAKPTAAPDNHDHKDTAMKSSVSPAGEHHPGQITYIDHVENRTWTQTAAEVPTTIAWVKVDDHWKAVVQIEINGAGDRREITKYGANHVFLETTTATMGPPPAAPSQPQPVPTPMPMPTPTK